MTNETDTSGDSRPYSSSFVEVVTSVSAIGRIESALRSPAVRYAVGYGISGVLFVLANLLLARVLSTEEYATLTLAVAIINLAIPLAPLGADGLVNRHDTKVDQRLLGRAFLTAAVTAASANFAVYYLYELSTLTQVLIGISILFGGSLKLASAKFQAEEHFASSLLLSESPNIFLMGGAVLAAVLALDSDIPVLAVLSTGTLIMCFVGWIWLFSHPNVGAKGTSDFDWKEALSYAGILGAILFLTQLERLIIPKALSMDDLATFAVLAAVAGSPYRMLQQGLAFTLLPRIRRAETLEERRELMKHEMAVAAGFITLSGIVIWFVAPIVVDIAVGDRYVLDGSLYLAAIITGSIKVCDQLTKSTVTALAGTARLASFTVASWISVTVAVIGGYAGARWGLAGLIYGVGAGWALRTAIGSVYAQRYLGHRAE